MERTKYLPIEIVEQIIARMPYPSIFKCRCLLKSWLARFAPISAQANKAEKLRAILFQKQVGEWSNSWKTLCPVFAKYGRDFIAYDRVSHKWRRLPPLPLPEGTMRGEHIQIEGAFAFYTYGIESKKYVANILTGEWKQLPTCPNVDHRVLREKLVTYASSEFYKLFLLCFCQRLYIQIYDSKLGAWSIKEVVVSSDLTRSIFYPGVHVCTKYLNGVLYCEGFQLNIEDGTLKNLGLLSARPYYPIFTRVIMMVSWKANLLIALQLYSLNKYDRLKVLKFDFQSEQLSELAEYSFPALEISSLAFYHKPVFDGHCIFFGVEAEGTRILTYDVDKNDWSCFPIPALTSCEKWEYQWIGSAFQTGLNPFAAV